MRQIFAKSFGGLTGGYYLRQFLFGLIFPAFLLLMTSRSQNTSGELSVQMWIWMAICTFLYPYARFVYESVVGYVMGENVFFVNAFLMLAVKILTMLLCWVFALFIAPIGLIWLYFHHSRREAQQD